MQAISKAMDDTPHIRIHIIVFLTIMVLYALNMVNTEKYVAVLQTYMAIMVGAIYFKIKRQ